MKELTDPCFIVIDDDPINNLICRKNIQNIFADARIDTYTDPQLGLEHIYSQVPLLPVCDTILFLDINMPVLSGWDVLDKLMLLHDDTKQQLRIYMLSSTIATSDRDRATGYAIVKGFLVKPLTRQAIVAMCSAKEV